MTFDPKHSRLEIEQSRETVWLTPENVARLGIHAGHPDSKLVRGYSYVMFYRREAPVVRLNQLFFAEHEFLEKHFAAVPQALVYHRLP